MKVVELRGPASDAMLSAACQLREMADQCESGELTEVVVVGCLGREEEYVRYASFNDRWRLIGALECAKSLVCNS